MEAIMTGEHVDGQGQPPAEAVLLDEDDTAAGADLKGKVREAWQEFATTLASVLRELAPGTTLDLTLDPTASGTGAAVYAVRIIVGDSGDLTAAAVSNAMLPEGYRLDRSAVGALVALGWSPPGVLDRSGDFFGLRLPVTDASRLAVAVSRTMRDVYGAPHPAFLTYEANGPDDEAVVVPALGAARLASAQEIIETTDEAATEQALARLGEKMVELPLADRVSAVVATLLKTTPEALSVDPDGDIGIRAGSAMVFVRVRDNPPLIDVFSPILTEIEPSEQLYVKLSELTNRMPIGRLYCTSDTVWASVPVFGRDFQPTHLMLAVQVMTGLADELDDRLHGEFGGKRFFGEGDKPAIKGKEGERTGMYL
jgi:T3SS (YopN, CesT) and YbjN peptide-binding chaperone 1/T3SS (YopN, CesT) and YbjN peptide-binding chaperone 3